MASRAYSAQNAVFIAAECSSAEGLAAVIASCSPLAFQGMDESSAVNCHKRPLYPVFEASEETGDEDICDETAHHVEKKRRLSVEQVKSLEKNFELENKLEPDRKIQLAKELGLQPRQVAVWFQNRRARWKTKQLEKDYDVLKAEYDDLKSNYVDLMQEKDRLHDEVARLKERLSCDEKESEAGTCPQTKVKLEEDFKSVTSNEQADTSAAIARSPICKVEAPNSLSTCKREGSFSSDSDASDILEAESPRPRFESEPAQSSELTAPYTDTAALLYLSEDPYCRALLPSVYQRPALKVEDGSDHSLEDQGAFSWWDWA